MPNGFQALGGKFAAMSGQDVVGLDQFAQGRHGEGRRREGRVVVEAADVMHDPFGRLGDELRHGIRQRQPPGDIGQKAARMGEDPADTGIVFHCARQNQICGRPSCVAQEFDQETRRVEGELYAGLVEVGMEEDHGVTPVQFGHQFGEARISKKISIRAAKEHDAVGVKRIERVCGLLAGRLGERHWQHGEGAEAPRILDASLRRKLVAGPRQIASLPLAAAEMNARRG